MADTEKLSGPWFKGGEEEEVVTWCFTPSQPLRLYHVRAKEEEEEEEEGGGGGEEERGAKRAILTLLSFVGQLLQSVIHY